MVATTVNQEFYNNNAFRNLNYVFYYKLLN
jgi:hypothetical protein